VTASIIGVGHSPYTRHPGPESTTSKILAAAGVDALRSADLHPAEIDGLGVASFTLGPDHAIDLAWRMGLSLSWLMDDPNGGASAGTMLQHAVHAIESGAAKNILLISGDHMKKEDFAHLVAHYNTATEDHLVPLPMLGPNALFAMLTKTQMEAYGLAREDYGRIAIAQREWAGLNPYAAYRAPLSMDEYLQAPAVADPLHRYDCVPPVSGGDAIVVTADGRGRAALNVLSTRASYSFDGQQGSGIETGISQIADSCWNDSGLSPDDIGIVSAYDDYPAMVVSQLIDTGIFSSTRSVAESIAEQISTRRLPVNTSGGQLSAGQAGASGGMHGLAEVATQLLGRAGARQVEARFGVVSGYGMVLYRYGACATMTVLKGTQ
jgi:acetyl-CoA acetyltransferase